MEINSLCSRNIEFLLASVMPKEARTNHQDDKD